jgi:hypothetical protein
MTAFALPHFRRRKSKPQQAAEAAVKIWTAMKLGSAVASTAKKGAKAYGKFKVVKFVGKRSAKLLVIPVAAGGGVVAYKKLTSSSSDSHTTATPYGSPVGPVATPATVTPPKTAPGADLNGEGALSDPPAGASNPPTSPGTTS